MPILSSLKSRFLGKNAVPAAPVPVAGSELLMNGGFNSDASGWSVINATLVSEAGGASGNGARLDLTGNGGYAYQSFAPPTGAWLLHTFAYKQAWNGHYRVGTAQGWNDIVSLSMASGAVWTNYLQSSRGASTVYVRLGTTNSVTGNYCYFDSISILPLTLASLISTRPYASADCDISVAVTRTAGTQAGISARVDSAASPANFIIAYLDGAGNVKVDKCVAGVYTNIIGGAVTYAAGRVLRLVCSGSDVSVYYNGTQVGSTTAVADAGIVGNKNHGLFSTYAANTFSGYVAT